MPEVHSRLTWINYVVCSSGVTLVQRSSPWVKCLLHTVLGSTFDRPGFMGDKVSGVGTLELLRKPLECRAGSRTFVYDQDWAPCRGSVLVLHAASFVLLHGSTRLIQGSNGQWSSFCLYRAG